MEQENRLADTSHTIDDSTFDTQEFFREHLVKSDSGKFSIQGNELSHIEMALLNVEVKRRGEQGATSREKARADRSELELSKVKENVRGMDQAPQIDQALKYSDPDEYIRQTLEAQSRDPYQDVFDASSKQASQESGQTTMDSAMTHTKMFSMHQVSKQAKSQDRLQWIVQ